MLITPDYCRMMARYNAWQNTQVRSACEKLTEAELRADRGAFFGSIMRTINHLLWGDQMWMSRFDGDTPPPQAIPQSGDLCVTLASWADARQHTDLRIARWAEQVNATDLDTELAWFSSALQKDITRSVALCVVHMFNHQTHHRGQIHAMLTSAGQNPGDTDLFILPESQ